MSVPQVAVAVFDQVEQALSDNFNTYLAQTCTAAGIADQAFAINWVPGTNYYRAGYTLQWLRDVVEDQGWPVVCLYLTVETDTHEQMPCTFSGPVEVGIAVYRRIEGRAPADLVMLSACISDALKAVLSSAYGPGMVQQGSVVIEHPPEEWLNSYWWQELHATVSFEITG